MVFNRNSVIDFVKKRSMFLFPDYLKDIDSLNQQKERKGGRKWKEKKGEEEKRC